MEIFKNLKIFHMIMLSICIVFVLGATLNIILVLYSMRQQSLREAEAKARILLDRNMATHTYFSQIMKPKLLEWTTPLRTKEYFDPSWMSSTYAVREIHKYFNSFNSEGYYIKDAAINARSPENEADDFERAFLEKLKKDDKLESYSEVRMIAGKPYLTVMRKGEVVEQSCLLCHGNPDEAPGGLISLYGPERSFHRKIGDTISIISMRIPLSAAYSGGYGISLQLSLLLAIVLLLLLGIQLFLYRRFLIAPLGVIRDKALAIAGNRDQLGEKISAHAGREFKELADAFNEMSQQLRIGRDRLEDRVAKRTVELNAANAELKREVGERRRMEEALRTLSSRQEAILASVPEIIMEVDSNKVYTWANSAGIEFFGEEVIGKEAASYFEGEQETYSKVSPLFRSSDEIIYVESLQRRRDGEKRLLAWWCRVLKDETGQVAGALSSARDITEHRLAEEKIKASLREKETMLKEIHHRVKNNLQVISSLLGLQSSYIKDEESREIFREGQHRVRIMANIHTQLYQSQNLSRVDLGLFIRDLIGNIRQSSGRVLLPVEINLDADEIHLGIDSSIPCGLILNELVTNALKHAFPGGKNGAINIRMRSDDNRVTLMVQDNGIGFPGSIDLMKAKTLGLELVSLLVDQMNGEIDMRVDGGTIWTITFPIKEEREWRHG